MAPRSLLVFLCLTTPSLARDILVSPAADTPVLANALRSAADGDTLRLAKGVYRETVVLTKHVALVGEDGAVLDPSQPFRPDWRPAPAIGRGVYQARVNNRPRALFLDGKVLAELDERRTAADGPWNWQRLLAVGPARSGFRFIRAIWIYRAAEKTVYLHLADDVDPKPLNFSAIWTTDPIVTFRSAAGASISHLVLAHGFIGVSMLDGARDCSISYCTIGPWERTGVLLTGGAAACRVEHNEIFRGSYEDWAPADNSRERYEVWQVHKLAGFYDRVGVNLYRAGADNRIRHNHVFETFDGIDLGDWAIESLDKPMPHPDDGKGTEIAHNLIERTRDSGIELGGGCIDVRVHHNTLRQTHGGLRYKLPRVGPIFIYRNLLIDGAPFNIWYSMDDSPAEGYVYHNTILGGEAALIYSSFERVHHIGAPKWHYLNNLVVCRKGFFVNWRTDAPVNFTADYNAVAGGGKPWPADPAKDVHSRYADQLPLTRDHRPAAGNPAIHAGLDLSTYLHGHPLPGCAPGYFQGPAPTIGALDP